jgi:hypothetical protein
MRRAPAAGAGDARLRPASQQLDFAVTVRDDLGMGFGSPDVNWPLVGRAAELKRATTLLGADRGAIVLAGAAGVGKTRLAAECLDLAATRGFVPLRVSATQCAAGCHSEPLRLSCLT